MGYQKFPVMRDRQTLNFLSSLSTLLFTPRGTHGLGLCFLPLPCMLSSNNPADLRLGKVHFIQPPQGGLRV